jgi:succinoglycan biosynthesis protein ExoA
MTPLGLTPLASVVIPCRNEKDHIVGCVRSMLSQESPEGEFEVIVADGLSNDGTRELLSELAETNIRLRVIDNPGRIVSTGLNAAIAAAKGRVIIRVDAHTQYGSDYIRQCVAVLNETGADNVGGPWVSVGEGYVGRAIAAVFQSPFGSGAARGHDAGYEGYVDTVYLGCWRREVFDRIGGFDEELVRNQDDELNLRLTRAGGKIWQSKRIRSWYCPRTSLRDLFQQYLQYGYWKVRVIQKHRLPASWRHLVPPAFVLTLVTLMSASAISSVAFRAAAVLGGVYALCTLAASTLTAIKVEAKLLPALPMVYACFHVGYGFGFLRGVWDFTMLRRPAAPQMSNISRQSHKPRGVQI